MGAGQGDARQDEDRDDLVQGALQRAQQTLDEPVQARQDAGQVHPSQEAFADHRQELDVEDGEIEADAHAHLEQGRVAVGHVRDEEVPDVVVAAQVDDDAESHEGVAEGRGEQRRPHQGSKRSLCSTWATKAVVKPPAAKATPVATSMPIQSPQGYWSSRLVTAPMPQMKRTAITQSPPSAISPRTFAPLLQ